MKRQHRGVRAACLVIGLAAAVVFTDTTASQGSSSTAGPSAPQAQPDAEQQLRTAHQQLIEAGRANDKEAAGRLMANDLTWVNLEGKTTTRDEMLAGTPTPPREVHIARVVMLAPAAIVTGTAELASGRKVRFVQQWVNRDGQWQVFAHQATAADADPSQPASTPAVGTAGHVTMRAAPPLLGSNDERAVWKAQTDLQRAFLRGDTAAYGRLTSDEFFRVAPNAEPQGKSDFLRVVKENAGQHAGKLETGDVQITVAGDTARVVMNIWGTLPNGNPVPPTRVTRVFARRSGQWQQAAAIFTPLAQQ